MMIAKGVRSGKVEPAWIATAGALVYEDVDASVGDGSTLPVMDPKKPPADVVDRYRPPGQTGGFLTVML